MLCADAWCHALRDLVAGLDDARARSCTDRLATVTSQYEQLSNAYQTQKDQNNIPLN